MTHAYDVNKIRCWWCDSEDIIVVSDNLYKCASCERFMDTVEEEKLERMKSHKLQDD